MRTLLVLSLAACATSTALDGPRFHNAAPVTVVDDRRDVPEPPAARDHEMLLFYFDGMFGRPLTRALELPRPRRALGVNAFDEVPDSTWFTNRLGIREVPVFELRDGPVIVGTPEAHKPWTILSSKRGGVSIGFVIRDARGEKFLLKFDPRGQPEAETAADVIVNRLLWAFGYNVPEDHVVQLRRDELVLSPDSTTKDALGVKRRLERAELDARLAEVEVGEDGSIRAMVSRVVDGKWLGGHPGEGVREDDPNDRIPHELRRDLRGQYAVFAWLDHLDIKEQNTLDMWVADRDDPKRHHVKHYLIDFGKSLGFMASAAQDPRRGFAYGIDYGEMLGSFASLGLWSRDWERRTAPALRGVGAYEATSYDPATWRPYTQLYRPLQTADRFDHFWSAKILIKFSREQLRAAVELGKLSDPRATEYLIETLVARQRATARHWFAEVAAVDRFTVERARGDHALCFDDLALAHRLESPLATQYRIARYDRHGRRLAEHAFRPGATARSCPPIALADAADGYTIIELAVTRSTRTRSTLVHVARDPTSREPRVIGVWRR
jgi:hypothetical protein